MNTLDLFVGTMEYLFAVLNQPILTGVLGTTGPISRNINAGYLVQLLGKRQIVKIPGSVQETNLQRMQFQ